MGLTAEKAHFNMIAQQIRPWGVIDPRVLDTMMQIPREPFVPEAYQGVAYADIEVPIGDGEAMMAPRVVARMLQALSVQPGERVLEIGAGTGYVTACLAALGGRVVSLEIDQRLLEQARANLRLRGVRKVDLRLADALAGPLAGAPFQVIAVTGSLPCASALGGLEEQLALGGRLFAVVGLPPVQEALLITRSSQQGLRRESLFETVLPALRNAPAPEQFVF
jgi:protein-L-isoaspartate(D-aspartate) O-methyltransferase